VGLEQSGRIKEIDFNLTIHNINNPGFYFSIVQHKKSSYLMTYPSSHRLIEFLY